MTARIRWSNLPASAMALLDPLEDDFLGWVMARAKHHGWLASHPRTGQTARGWRTLTQGDTGAFDVTLARAGVVAMRELKKNNNSLTPDQRKWAKELGDYGAVWKPRDAVAIEAWLSTPVDGVVQLG